MKRILVPTDFSTPALAAVETAMIIAQKAQGEIILLNIIELPWPGSFNVEGEGFHDTAWEESLFITKLFEKSKKELSQVVELVKKAGIQVRQEIRLGNAFHGIDTIITAYDVDLVVMGTEGHSKLEKMLIGSTTEKVVRQSRCPVLTVHNRPGPLDFKNIVYATSMIRDEDKFASVAETLRALFDSTLHVVWINTPRLFEPERLVMKTLKTFAARLKLRNFTLNVFSDYSEEEGILNFAESINANLIVMSTHGRKGLAHILSGSIAEGVSSHARRPVLTSTIK